MISFAKKIVLSAVCLGLPFVASADPVGVWKTFDIENPSIATSLVKVTLENGAYVGRLQKVVRAGATSNVCLPSHCSGEYAGKDLTNASVIWGFKSAGNNKYTGGTAYDLQHGKKYSATITDNGNTLVLTAGYNVLGKIIGKSTTWQRVQ